MYDFGNNSITAKPVTGLAPFVISIMPDSIKYYVIIHGSTISVVDINKKDITKLINFTGNYDPMTGKIRRPIEGLPISPNGKYMFVANTLTQTPLIIDTHIDKIVKMLPCDLGCHGV
jgi:DNA-binding beta-propeller fold protein YncE